MILIMVWISAAFLGSTPGFMCAQNLGLVVSDYTVTGEVDGEQAQAPDVSPHLFAAAP